MTPDQLAVLKATPSSRDVGLRFERIAERAGIDPSYCTPRLKVLEGMGLVEPDQRGYGARWCRTPAGDREAGRAR